MLTTRRNWKTFDERTFDFCQGITLHHLPGKNEEERTTLCDLTRLPGHTDGLIGMQINLQETGTFFFISDHCHVIENVNCLPLSVLSLLADSIKVARRHPTRLACA